MRERYLPLDLLRGLSVFGMVFSAIIPSGVLPPWMYHIQNPPPDHQLNMLQPGITWVDMVFPIFIFCMGVAIPLSGRKRLDSCTSLCRGTATSAGSSAFTGARSSAFTGAGTYFKDVFQRFIMLWVFSYLCVLMDFTGNSGILPQLLTLAGFCALFPLYIAIPRNSKGSVWRLRTAGVMLCAAVVLSGRELYGTSVTLGHRSIIIFLMAFLYLFGSTIWYFTRDRYGLRAFIFALLLLFTFITQIFDLPAITYANPSIRWWLNMEEFYFLLLLIPATFIGDLLLKSGQKHPQEELPPKVDSRRGTHPVARCIISILLAALSVWTLVFLYKIYRPDSNLNISRLISYNILFTGVALALLWVAIARYMPRFKWIFATSALLLIWGLFIDPLDNGVKKVPCTVSYCFITCSLSAMLLIICDFITSIRASGIWSTIALWPIKRLVTIFSGAGSNPMMSYVAYYILVVPILKLSGIMTWVTSLTTTPLAGTLRAALLVLLSIWSVSLFTRKRIFWRA